MLYRLDSMVANRDDSMQVTSLLILWQECLLKLDPLFEGNRRKVLTRVARNTCTQTVTVHRHAADVSVTVTSRIGSDPCGAGPVGVVVKILHRLGVQANTVVTPHGSKKSVLDLDRVVHPP
jgi:hypothetical protein